MRNQIKELRAKYNLTQEELAQKTGVRRETIIYLEKGKNGDFEANPVKSLDPDLLALMRVICQFEIHAKMAADNYSPNILTEYLFVLAQKFNAFYEKEKIIGSEKEKEKLAVSKAVANVLKQGLYLLGIESPEKI